MQNIRKILVYSKWIPFVLVITSCQTSTIQNCQKKNEYEKEIKQNLNQNNLLFYIKNNQGDKFIFSQGSAGLDSNYASGSTSKLVATVVILSLVDQGYLKLESRLKEVMAQDWPAEVNNLDDIKLLDLLNFTSGLNIEPDSDCLLDGDADFKKCVQNILVKNRLKKQKAGTVFWYGRNHLQVAGMMAIKARGFQTWLQVFEEFQHRTLLFKHSSFSHPSVSNPMLAGGMRWTASDYIVFLQDLIENKILSPELSAEIFKDQISKSLRSDGSSPPLDKLKQDWHYGLGVWLECYAQVYNCLDTDRTFSIPGLFGSYPFIDKKNQYFGLIAQESDPSVFFQQIRTFQKIKPYLDGWSKASCAK